MLCRDLLASKPSLRLVSVVILSVVRFSIIDIVHIVSLVNGFT